MYKQVLSFIKKTVGCCFDNLIEMYNPSQSFPPTISINRSSKLGVFMKLSIVLSLKIPVYPKLFLFVAKYLAHHWTDMGFL